MSAVQLPTPRARRLLRTLLRRGPRRVSAIIAEAQRRGIPAWALRKAKARERVRSSRKGFGPGNVVMWAPSWRWAIPRWPHVTADEPSETDAPSPPRCAWDGCTDPSHSLRARYCAAHTERSLQESKRAWRLRHEALVREAMARLVPRRPRASVERRARANQLETGTDAPRVRLSPSQTGNGVSDTRGPARSAAYRTITERSVSRGCPRLSVRLEPVLLSRVTEAARVEGIPISDVLRRAVRIYTEDVGPDGVMIRLAPFDRERLVKRLRDYPRHNPRAVLERFVQLALDGGWILTDRVP